MFKSFGSLLTIYGVTVMLLSLAATWFCCRYGYVADMPLTFLGSGIFFPISFGFVHRPIAGVMCVACVCHVSMFPHVTDGCEQHFVDLPAARKVCQQIFRRRPTVGSVLLT
jgi:hypothetical protein